jgi:LysM repeat protein
LSSRLKRMVEVLVGVVLAAAIVVVVPGVAEAQDVASTKDKPSTLSTAPKPTTRIVVRPGDSLWSISRQWLGTNASPRRITEGVEQIYALNQNRIGADPNRIFAGQKLVVPPAISERSTERSTPRESTRATSARKTTHAAEAGPRARAAAKDREALEPVAKPETKPETLPDASAGGARVPAVGSLASNDSPPSPVTSFLRTVRSALASVASVVARFFAETFAETRAEERQLFGLGIIVLTLLVAAFMAWKLPMKRTTRWEAAVWGMPTGYYGSAAYRIAPFAYHPGSLGDRVKQIARWQAPGSLGHKRRAVLTGSGDTSDTAAARGGRNAAATVARRRTLRAKAVPRNGLALGAHNPEVRRASLWARAFMGARNPRHRRGASFGLGARS